MCRAQRSCYSQKSADSAERRKPLAQSVQPEDYSQPQSQGRLAPTQELRLAQTSYPLAPGRLSLPNGKDLSTRGTTCQHSAHSKPPDHLNFQNESRPQGMEETKILLLCIICRNWNIFLSLFWNMIVFTDLFVPRTLAPFKWRYFKTRPCYTPIPGISVCKFPVLRSICISVNHRQLLRT